MYAIVCTYRDDESTVIGPFGTQEAAEDYASDDFDRGDAEYVEIVQLVTP